MGLSNLAVQNIEIKFVDPIANFDQAIELLRANWQESGQPFDFNTNDAKLFYTYMAHVNSLFAIGAYRKDELVGYCIITFAPNPLNHSVKICNVDGLYLLPELRGGRIFSKMTNAVRDLAHKHNVNYINWHAPAGSIFATVLESRFTPVCNYFREELTPIDRSIPTMSEESVEQAREIEKVLLDLPQVSIATDHVLHAGTYTRTIMVPKGVTIAGALVKRSVNLIISGHVVVFIGDDKAKEYNGYAVLQASAHRKQVFIAKEDTFLTMFFTTEAKSIEEAEAEFTYETDLLGSRLPQNINNIVITGE